MHPRTAEAATDGGFGHFCPQSARSRLPPRYLPEAKISPSHMGRHRQEAQKLQTRHTKVVAGKNRSYHVPRVFGKPRRRKRCGRLAQLASALP